MFFFSSTDFISILPEIFFGIAMCITLLFFSFITTIKINNKGTVVIDQQIFIISFLILFLTFILFFNNPGVIKNIFYGALKIDTLNMYTKQFTVIFSILTLFISNLYIKKNNIVAIEYYILILISNFAIFFIIQSNDFISLYLSLELQALAFYTLTAFKRNSSFSTEAGLKYLITGSFSSGLLLFGISLIYGFSGTTNYEILCRLYEGNSNIIFGVIIGLFFIFSSLLFKLAAAPFHQWAPDVYEGAPTSTTLFFSIVPKISLLCATIRIIYETFNSYAFYWQFFFIFSAILSLFFSNISALYQKRIKRFLVFSTLGHLGYIFFAFSTNTFLGNQTVFVYILTYIIISSCLWSLVISLSKNKYSSPIKYIDEMKYIAKENVFISFTIAMAIFSIAGIPPLIGFYPKFFVFFSLMNSNIYFNALIIILASVIGAFYYLRIIKILFFEEIKDKIQKNSKLKIINIITKETSIITSFLLFIIIFFFIYPNLIYLITFKIALTFC